MIILLNIKVVHQTALSFWSGLILAEDDPVRRYFCLGSGFFFELRLEIPRLAFALLSSSRCRMALPLSLVATLSILFGWPVVNVLER